eukprot:9995221-Karenia_brevis.AAC.1
MLSEWLTKKDSLNAHCMRCVVREDPSAHEVQAECMSCKQYKGITEYSIGAINIWRARGEKLNQTWRCFDHQHPPCKQCVELPDWKTNAPLHPIPQD